MMNEFEDLFGQLDATQQDLIIRLMKEFINVKVQQAGDDWLFFGRKKDTEMDPCGQPTGAEEEGA